MASETKFKETEIGMIPEDWNITRLEEISLKVTDGSHFSPKEFSNGNRIICTVKDMKYNNFSFNDAKNISDEDFDSLVKNGCSPEVGDILISKDGANCLDLIFVYNQEEKIVLLSSIAIVKLKKSFNPYFFRYYLLSPQAQKLMRNGYVSGSAIPRVILKDFKNLPVPVPPQIEMQDKIADIMWSLDQKVDLNNQINSTLEQIAQALFKRWFIDFEFPDENGNPYKSSGGRMVDSEFGEIPEGWEVKKIGDYLNTISKTYPLKAVSEVIFLNTGDIQNGKVLHSNKSTVETLPGQAKKSIQKDDILYSEIRPENKRFAYVFFDGKEHVVSTKLMVLRPIADIDSKFLYFILTQQNIIDFLQMIAESRSGTFPQITFNEISQVEFFGPKDNTIIHIFSKSILTPFMQERYSRDEENIRLSNIRDSLLPKLMSGKIRVKV